MSAETEPVVPQGRGEGAAVAGGRGEGPRGTAAFLHLVRFLVRRPRRADRRLPLILIGGEGSAAVLDALARRLTAASRHRVPHVPLVADRHRDGADVRSLLNRLCQALSVQNFGGERLWFRHYALLEWLMRSEQDLSGLPPDDRPAELARRLRAHRRHPAQGGVLDPGATGQLGAVYQILWWLLQRAVPAALFRIAVSGRVPGLGRRYRWFMRQQYLAPAQSVTFLGFAERLTPVIRDGEHAEQVDKLLVHAFLEDLRQAYSRFPRRMLRGRRRTAYPVVMITGVEPGDAADRLFGLVNDVRNETGRLDPLLLVCSGDRFPPRVLADARTTRVVAIEDLKGGEEDWRDWAQGLPRTRRARARGAWYLAVATSGPSDAERVGGLAAITAPKPPWYARRIIAAAVVLALLVPTAGWIGRRLGGPDCLHAPFAGQVSVRGIEGECIGYSAVDAVKFNDQPGQENLRRIQERIFSQNRRAQDIWERGERRRPYVTVVYLGTLTGRSTRNDEEAYAGEREELEGLAVAQYQGLQDSASAYGAPLLRVVVANGGFQMRHAGPAVDMIAELARQETDAPVVGVVGLVESRESTAGALYRLNQAGLPVVAPTLSADGMHRNSKLYLQLAAPNKDQVEAVATYARTVLRTSRARIYYTVGERATLKDDLYVGTLLDDLRERFGDDVEYVELFRRGDSLGRECGYEGMLFFAGRWSEFNSFLQSLKTSCADDQPRHLVADDSVNRYMANPSLRESAPGNLPLVYVSKAALATCDALADRTRGGRDEAAGRFLRSLRKDDLLTPPRCLGKGGPDDLVGERVGLSYDATMLLQQAVETLAGRVRTDDQPWDPRSINAAAVHAEVLHQSLVKPFPGVTGSVRFAPGSGEPVAKRISLLRIASIPDRDARPTEVLHCGIAKAGDDPACVRPRR